MLAHPRAKVNACLADVFRVLAAAAFLEVNSFLVKLVGASLVGAAQDVTQFGSWLGVVIHVSIMKGLFELAVDR